MLDMTVSPVLDRCRKPFKHKTGQAWGPRRVRLAELRGHDRLMLRFTCRHLCSTYPQRLEPNWKEIGVGVSHCNNFQKDRELERLAFPLLSPTECRATAGAADKSEGQKGPEDRRLSPHLLPNCLQFCWWQQITALTELWENIFKHRPSYLQKDISK